jgi:hypothetical protein
VDDSDMGGRPRKPGPSEESVREARDRARSWVYERLALLSAAIWVVGTFLLFVSTVPFVPRPQLNIAVAMTLPLIPAALPWLLYRRLSEMRARHLLHKAASAGEQ